jgi:hypothetical protein
METRLHPAPKFFPIAQNGIFQAVFCPEWLHLMKPQFSPFECKCWGRMTLNLVCANKQAPYVLYKPWGTDWQTPYLRKCTITTYELIKLNQEYMATWMYQIQSERPGPELMGHTRPRKLAIPLAWVIWMEGHLTLVHSITHWPVIRPSSTWVPGWQVTDSKLCPLLDVTHSNLPSIWIQ